MATSRTRRAIGTIEVLVAAALIGVIVIPLLTLSSRGVVRTQEDRARVVAGMLGSNLFARLGHRGPELSGLFTATGPEGEGTTGDLLARPDVAREIGADPLAPLIRQHQISARLRLTRAALPGADLLVCEVRWISETRGIRIEEHALFERLIVHDTL